MFDNSVRERDLDHFLLEELSASPAFLDWFLGWMGGAFRVPSHSAVRVQRSPRRLTDTRQTDHQIGFIDNEDVTGVILIENKVTDGFQDGQPEAYGDEIAAWRERVGQEHGVAVLVSPRSNLAVQGGEHFHVVIHIEVIVDHLAARLQDDMLALSAAAFLSHSSPLGRQPGPPISTNRRRSTCTSTTICGRSSSASPASPSARTAITSRPR